LPKLGYITKAVRQELGLEKTHTNDAFVSERSGEAKRPFIAEGRKQKRLTPINQGVPLAQILWIEEGKIKPNLS
jgi:hypothetical protein